MISGTKRAHPACKNAALMLVASLFVLLSTSPAPSSAPILVWAPALQSDAPADVVLYVHGYNDTAETAIRKHHLFEQFKASGKAAVFIVPEAPSSPNEPVFFPDLERLLVRVERQLQRALSRRGIILVGHSGAYRTLRSWLDHSGVREVILLDAMYGDTTPFARWIERTPEGHLTIVSHSTLKNARAFLARIDGALVESGRISHLVSSTTHMGIVIEGVILPEALGRDRTSSIATVRDIMA